MNTRRQTNTNKAHDTHKQQPAGASTCMMKYSTRFYHLSDLEHEEHQKTNPAYVPAASQPIAIPKREKQVLCTDFHSRVQFFVPVSKLPHHIADKQSTDASDDITYPADDYTYRQQLHF